MASSQSSSSFPEVLQSPQSEWGLLLSQLEAALGQNMISWANQQFTYGKGITDRNIGQFLDAAGQAAGFANNLLGRYQSVFEPLMDKYIQQASSYNSQARQRFMMGQAESTAGQADQAALDSAQAQLQSYGINPNSGRYQDLLLSKRLADAANRAGAGTQASLNTAAIGRQMTQNAVQMGQNVPGMWATAANTRTTALNAAEQALLGLLNTGANMMNVGANYMNAAGNANRLPPVGQVSQSGGMNTGPGGGGGGDKGDGKGWGHTQVPPHVPDVSRGQYRPAYGSQQNSGMKRVENQYQPDMKIQKRDPSEGTGAEVPDWYKDPNLPVMPPTTGPGNTQWPDPNGPDLLPGSLPNTNNGGIGDWNAPGSANKFYQPPDMGTDPWQNVPTSGTFGVPGQDGSPTNLPQPQQQEDVSPMWDPQQQVQSPNFDQNWGELPQQEQMPPDMQGTDPFQMDPYNQWGQDQYNWEGQNNQYEPQQGNYGGYQPQYQPQEEGGYYAAGGKVGQQQGVIPTTGGHVPRSASPSGGAQTDDIPARLNADEYVIPKDVVHHFGSKHFDGIVAKSRKLRTGMAGPQPQAKQKPALRMRPTFVSKHMGV